MIMKAALRLFAVLALALSALGLSASPVLAAAPSNDTSAGATLVTAGFSEVLDTTEATTDAEDAQLNSTCGAPATDASVWYTIQGTGMGIIVDVSQSNYSAGVLVGVGTPGNLTTIACSPVTVAFLAEAGTTYYVLAIDDQQDGSGNGGSLSIAFSEAPPPPTVDVTVNRYGKVNTRTGVATISGTYTCTSADYLELFIDASQRAGRFTILGSSSFSDFGTCDGTAQSWSADIYPVSGKFAGGKAMTVTFAIACGAFQCGFGYTEQVVILQGKK
jgi:hypothetical protein